MTPAATIFSIAIAMFIWCNVVVYQPVAAIGFALVFGGLFWSFVIRGSQDRLQRAGGKLASTLMADEKVLHWAIEQRIAALFSRRVILAVTNSRIIRVQRPVLGGFNMGDYQWKDLVDATFAENMIPTLFGSQLGFSFRTGSFSIDGVVSGAASEVYRYSQRQEQAWEEKNRLRALEETRAAAGGVQVNTAPGGGPAGAGGGSMMAQIAEAKALLTSGAITDAEFEELKARLLSR